MKSLYSKNGKTSCLWYLIVATVIGHGCDASEDVKLEIKALLNKNTTIKETFLTNVQDNAVVMQFQLHSGLICYAAFDFKNNVKVFKLDVLGETELGQKQYLSMCFLTKLKKEDFIPSDAMAKLRQKTSGSVQEANDILKPEDFETDVELKNIIASRSMLGEKFYQLCSGHESIVYAKESELLTLANGDPQTFASLQSLTSKPAALQYTLPKCSLNAKLTTKATSCMCKIPFTIPWYPCVIKYCSSKNAQGQTVTTRCGIRSCSATYYLTFVASSPSSCHWGVT